MYQRRFTGLAFLLVVLAAAAGAYLARDWARGVQPPSLEGVASLQDVVAEVDIFALIPRRSPSLSAEPVGEGLVQSSAAITAGMGTETAIDTSGLDAAMATMAATPTAAPPTPTPTLQAAQEPEVAFPFVLARPVEHSVAGCPALTVRGTVRDAAGNPLPAVRLWRYDQWGNEEIVQTRGGGADAGVYDFTIEDTPNVHYVQIIDSTGAIVSPVVEVAHRQGEAGDAVCHVVDWTRR